MVFPALLALFAATPPPRDFAGERLLLDRRLETLRRILPDGPSPLADVALVRELAEGAKLLRVEVTARPAAETGSRGEVPVEVVAFGRFAEVDRFFRSVALSHRLVDVEALTLTATPEDVIRLTAVVRLPYRPLRAPLPAPPESSRGRPTGVARPLLEAYYRDQALALSKSEAIAGLRRTRRNPRVFLSELSAIPRDRPVVLSYASLGDDFVVRGLGVGEGPMRALESRFERGFLRVSDFLMARQGACHRFEVRGRAPVAGVEAELPLPSEDPFEQDDAPCRIDRDPQKPIYVKAANAKTPGKGSLTLRLRDVDYADVFRVIHLLTGQGFLVDGDVTGRVTVELNKVTFEELVAALVKTGIDVQATGPVRRVSLSHVANRKSVSAHGEPTASFALKRAEVREILAVMTDIDPTLAALGPPGFLGRVSLWAKDLPVSDLRAAVLEAAGLTERFEEGRRMLERKPGAEEALQPVAGSPPEQRLVLGAQDLAVLEFELAGVAASGESWLAVAYSPTGVLNAYRPGDRLADGSLKSVSSTDATLDSDEGTILLTVPPLPR
jgi:hypothetical protein